MQTDPHSHPFSWSEMMAEWAMIDNARQYISFHEP